MATIKSLIKLWTDDRNLFYKELEIYAKENKDEVCSGILLIYQHLNEIEKKQEMLNVINRISIENKPPIFVFLFYYHWFISDALNSSEKEALILLGKMSACMDASFPSPIKFLYNACKADIFFDEETNTEYIKAFSLLPPDSEFFRRVIMGFVYENARNGRLGTLSPHYLNSLPENIKNLFSFFNAVENGQINEALLLKKTIELEKLKVPDVVLDSYKNSSVLLDLQCGQKNISAGNEAILTVTALLNKNPEAALKEAIRFYDKYPPMNKVLTNFFRFTLIRAQLANSNLDASRLIIDSWKKHSRRFYFADFFSARMELLNKNPEKAIYHFAKVLEICKKYDAMGRLDFELELALELQPKQIRFLMEQSNMLLTKTEPDKEMILQKPSPPTDFGIDRIKGVSLVVKSIKEEIKKIAALEIPVLILGETGVGKDVIANAIHEESLRKSEPFLAINCSAIAESLLLSELFGHEAGAYTGATGAHKGIFQEAGNGTVFLDEIGDISSSLQVALLRVLESGEYRPVGSAKPKVAKCRIIAATNALLESRVDAGTFRLDLLYRLKRLIIQIPPLRERPVDISFYCNYYLNLNKDPSNYTQISQELAKAFLAYSWPGNVRELKNEMEKIRLLHSGKSAYTLDDAGFLKSKTIQIQEKSGNKFQNKKEKQTNETEEEVFKSSGSYFRRIKTIKNLFLVHKTLSRKEICQISGIHNITLGNDLKTLIKENFITKVEPTKSPRTHYFILKE